MKSPGARTVDTVKQMPDLLRSAMGRSEGLTKESCRTDRHWIKGVRIARDRFGSLGNR